MIRAISILYIIYLGLSIPILNAQNYGSASSSESSFNRNKISPLFLKGKIPEIDIFADNKLSTKLKNGHLATFQTKESRYICMFDEDNELTLIFILPKEQSKKIRDIAYDSARKIAQILDSTKYMAYRCGNKSQYYFMMEFTEASKSLRRKIARDRKVDLLIQNPLNLILYLTYKVSTPTAWVNNRPLWQKSSYNLNQSYNVHVNINENTLQSIDITLESNQVSITNIIKELNGTFNLNFTSTNSGKHKQFLKNRNLALDYFGGINLMRYLKNLRIISTDAPNDISQERYRNWTESKPLRFPSKLTNLDKLLNIDLMSRDENEENDQDANESDDISIIQEEDNTTLLDEHPNSSTALGTVEKKPKGETIEVIEENSSPDNDVEETAHEKLTPKEAVLKYIEKLRAI